MIIKSKIIEKYKDYDDRILANNIIESAVYCSENYTSKHTAFLDPRQINIAEEILSKLPDIKYTFEGGIEASERKVCFIFHEALDIPDVNEAINIIKFSWYHSSKKLSHRDFLGSLIGNGIKREIIGDIILEEANAFLACKSEIANFILLNVPRIGNVAVKSELVEVSIEKLEKVKMINSTVSSLRLDCIISCGYSISRAKALEYIKGSKVKVNWEEISSAAKETKQGDTISLRGKGRIVLEEIAGSTKKDRVKVTIKKYI